MRKQLHYVTLLLLFFNVNTLFGENYVDLYINTYKDIAIREMMRSGIPASITLAQGIHESSWGRGELALNSNNHFGIKCKDYWEGPSFYYEDDDFDNQGKLMKSCFRAYENPERSYIDHTDFLMNTAHYQVLFNYSNTDYMRWAKGLKKCGYATDKEYANKLIRTIKEYKLYKYDLQAEQRVLASAPTYKIPKRNINDLVIRTDENEEQLFSALDIPKAIQIPDDYTRKFEVFETVKIENRKMRKFAQNKKEEVIKEIIPLEREKVTYEEEYYDEYKIEPRPFNSSVAPTKTNKESIIPVAFASTEKAYHLTRKPRSSSANLR